MLNALIPVFALILIGAILNYLAFPGVEFWRGAERLTYYLLFPALLFLRLSSTSVSGDIQLSQLAILLIGMLLIISVVLILGGIIFGMRGALFTSFYQGGIRFNTYVGLAAINGLIGDGGIAIAALVVGVMIPVVNLLCISVFAYAGDSPGKTLPSIIRNIITNPLILACALGILWNNFELVLPDLSIRVLELLSAAALPLGLLSVGAGIHLAALRSSFKALIVSSLIKLFVFPLLAYALCRITDVGEVVTMVVVIIASLPTASSAYILSRELGGDSKAMAAIITGHTLLAMISMPLVINYLV